MGKGEGKGEGNINTEPLLLTCLLGLGHQEFMEGRGMCVPWSPEDLVAVRDGNLTLYPIALNHCYHS